MANSNSLFTRRSMVVGLAGTAAVGATVGTVATQDSGTADSFSRLIEPVIRGNHGVNLGSATADDWRLQRGTYFYLHTGHVLQLSDVQYFPEADRPKGMREDAFVVRFDSVKGGVVPGSVIYGVSHEEGGRFDMFVTPGDPTKPLRMIAVFG